MDENSGNTTSVIKKHEESGRYFSVEKFHLVVPGIGGPIGFPLAGLHPKKVLSRSILNTWIVVVRVQETRKGMFFWKRKGLGNLS